MSIQLSHQDGAVVIAVQNAAELVMLGRMAQQLAPPAGTAVVVDVAAMAMAPTESAEEVVAQVSTAAGSTRACWALVASRLAARRILRRLCADTAIGVFPSIGAALAALPYDAGRTSPQSHDQGTSHVIEGTSR